MNPVDISVADKVYANAGNRAVLLLVREEPSTILDVGCGAGDNASWLFHRGHTVDGITLSGEEAAICERHMRRVWVHNLEQGLPTDVQDTYDYILCSHVLEHIVNPNPLLGDLRKHLSPGGYLIVALPNIMHYRSRLKLMAGHFDYAESGVWDYTHVRWYTYRSGRQLLERNGYQVTKSFVDGDIPMLSILGFISPGFRRILFRGLAAVSKGLFGGQMIYLAQTRDTQQAIQE